MSLRIYISGPMAGIHAHNYDAFYGAAVTLRGIGHRVLNPAELGADLDSWREYLCRDIIQLIEFAPEVVVTLPGWEASKGACIECYNARMLFDSEVIDFDSFISRQSRK